MPITILMMMTEPITILMMMTDADVLSTPSAQGRTPWDRGQRSSCSTTGVTREQVTWHGPASAWWVSNSTRLTRTDILDTFKKKKKKRKEKKKKKSLKFTGRFWLEKLTCYIFSLALPCCLDARFVWYTLLFVCVCAFVWGVHGDPYTVFTRQRIMALEARAFFWLTGVPPRPVSLSISVSLCLYLCLCLAVYLCLCLSVFLCPCMSVCLSLCFSLSLCVSVFFSPCVCVSLSLCLSVFVWPCVSLSVSLSLFLWPYVCECLSLCVSLSVSVLFLFYVAMCLSLYFSVSVRLSPCFCLYFSVPVSLSVCLRLFPTCDFVTWDTPWCDCTIDWVLNIKNQGPPPSSLSRLQTSGTWKRTHWTIVSLRCHFAIVPWHTDDF